MHYWDIGRENNSSTHAMTANMLIEATGTVGYELTLSPSYNFDGIEYVVMGSTKAPETSEPGSTLHCFRLDDIDDTSTGPAIILAPRNSNLPDETRHRLISLFHGKCIVLEDGRENRDLTSLYNTILYFERSIITFSGCLDSLVAAGGSCQDLIDVAERFFGCFISFVDSTHTLVAYTKGIKPYDEISRSLIQLGYHAEKFLSQERQVGYLSEKIQKQRGGLIFPPDNNFPCSLVTFPIYIAKQYAGYILMECEESQVTDGTLDTFAILANRITRLIKESDESKYWLNNASNNLLLKLFSDNDTKRRFLIEEAERLNIPTMSNFALVEFVLTRALRNQMRRIAVEVDSKFSFPHEVIIYNQRLYMMIHANELDELWSYMLQIKRAKMHNAISRLFLSDVFTWLGDAYFACQQLSIIEDHEHNIDICRSLSGFEGESNVVNFRDAFCFFLDGNNDSDNMLDFCRKHMLINAIYKDDIENGTNNLPVLFTFLANERRATNTGERIHMHRNGVLYRIERIERMYQISLDDYLTRQYLETSIRMLIASNDNNILAAIGHFATKQAADLDEKN